VVTRPRLVGICGSDSKQALLDFGEGDVDNAMAGLCTFPQVMGHEVVAEIVSLGPEARGVDIGQRVVLNPWLSCGPRGVTPLCPSCQAGDFSLCHNFTTGPISAGIHTGVASDATGGYAELMPAHTSMLFPVPDGMADEDAIFAREIAEAQGAEHVERAGVDWYGFTLAFKGVLLEGLEVVFIVLTFGSAQGSIPLAAAGAAAALVLVAGVGVAVRAPQTVRRSLSDDLRNAWRIVLRAQNASGEPALVQFISGSAADPHEMAA